MWVVADVFKSAVLVLRHTEVVFHKTEEVRVSPLTKSVQTQPGIIIDWGCIKDISIRKAIPKCYGFVTDFNYKTRQGTRQDNLLSYYDLGGKNMEKSQRGKKPKTKPSQFDRTVK